MSDAQRLRRVIWLSAVAIAAALLLHAAVPRYDWRVQGSDILRFDRWTGQSVGGNYASDGHWLPRGEWLARRAAEEEATRAAELEKAIRTADAVLADKPASAGDPAKGK